jgi:hypothetical protein
MNEKPAQARMKQLAEQVAEAHRRVVEAHADEAASN